MIGQRIDAHVLILQLERANEALSDRVTFLEEVDDVDYERGITELHERIDDVRMKLLEVSELLAAAIERIVQLERNQVTLIDAFVQ
jgi:hypothetical protein